MSHQEQLTRRAFIALSAAGAASLALPQAAASSEEGLNLWTEARRMMADGMIGEPYYVSVRTHLDRCGFWGRNVAQRVVRVLDCFSGYTFSPIGFVPEIEGYPRRCMMNIEFQFGPLTTIHASAHHNEIDTYVFRGKTGTLRLHDGPAPQIIFEDDRDKPMLRLACATRSLS